MLPNHLYAVIFDFGGVFLKTVDYTPRHRWDTALNLPVGSVEQVVHGSPSWRAAQTGRITPADYWADIAAQLKLSGEQTAQLAADFYSGDQLDQALVQYARGLRQRGVIVGLLSNDSLELLPRLARLGIQDLFEPLVVSAQIGVMKPDAASYKAILTQLPLPPAQTIFVDDLPANLAGAQAVGMHALHYTKTPAVMQGLEDWLHR